MSWPELAALVSIVKRTMEVADEPVIRGVFELSADCFLAMRSASGEVKALLATLPLNDAGASAVADGSFDARRPDPGQFADAGEAPAAIYVWLLWAPSRLVDGLRLVDRLLSMQRRFSGPLFARPASPSSIRLLTEMGFLTARSVYPDASEDMMVVLPEASAAGRSARGVLDVRVARTMEDVLQAFAVRAATYLVEQGCPYAEEFDGNDFVATHLIASVDREVAGCARIRWFGDFAKIERMAVLPRFRRSRLAFRLARFAIEHCQRKGFRRIYAHSRADLVPLWRMFGLELMPDRPLFAFSEMRFREMACELPDDGLAIRFGMDPHVMNRPEGAWDRPGPLERQAIGGSGDGCPDFQPRDRSLGACEPAGRGDRR